MSKPRPIALYTKTWRSGGAGLFAQELVAGMLDAGAEVIFIAPAAEDTRFERPRPGLTRLRANRELETGGKLRRVVASLGRVTGAALNLARARMQARVFVVTIPDPLIFAMPMLVLLRLSGAKILYVVHDPLPHAWKTPPALHWVENLGFKTAYGVSAALVVLSEAGKQVLTAHYRVAHKPVAVIEHGVFTLDSTLAAPGDGRLLLFGTLRRNKGVREAMEGIVAARARGATARLVVAGGPDPVEPDYWQACEPIARAHPEAIDLEVGYVEQDRLDALVSACDAFLLPYRDFHSQSGVAMLAASNARALIASRAGGIGELIADGMAAVAIEDPVGATDVADAVLAFAAEPIAAWNARALAYRAKTMESRAWPVIGADYVALARKVDPQ